MLLWMRVKPCNVNFQFSAPDINWPSHIEVMPFEPTDFCAFGIFPFDTYLCINITKPLDISINVSDNHLIKNSRNVMFKLFTAI